jgi:hypothetical protein
VASIKEKALFSLALILGVLVLGTIAFGWTNPAQNPPGGNVAAPLNAGGGTQVKTGGLNLGGNFSVTGTATFAGNVAIGTSTIGDKLTVVDSGGAVILLRSTNADTSSGLELQNDARKWALQVRGDDSDKLYIRDVTANAQRIIIDSSGKITIPGGQIGFPASQVASSDANTLDDYEEGT